MATLKFTNLCKTYDKNVKAVIDFNLDIADKEFVVFVGPSGCGKSTTLRMVAGLEEITSGELYIDDVLVNDVAPKDRDIAMVFQNYALYPHLTVYENMAFGLKLRKAYFPAVDKDGNPIYGYNEAKVRELESILKTVPTEDEEKREAIQKEIDEVKSKLDTPYWEYRHYNKKEISERVHAAAQTLALEEYLKRKPSALSGGQRQRVALGRAIVRNPKVFLMDEPLSNLDAKLRVQMRSEIIKIHRAVGATSIYVTHDQTEAMTMADRIVIMKDGVVQQIGTPKEVYETPSNMFVAGFIGAPNMNFFKGKISKNEFIFADSNQKITLTKDQISLLKEYDEKEIVIGVRPEDIYLSDDKYNEHKSEKIPFMCEISELLGSEIIGYGDIEGQRLVVKLRSNNEIENKEGLSICFDMSKVHFFDPETTNAIRK